jgi:hypothetical protein
MENTATARTFSRPEAAQAGIRFVRPSKLEGPGLVVEGIYLGSVPNNFDNTKSDYQFEEADGTKVVINSTGQLASQMKNIDVGTLCQVNYKGKQTIAKGKLAGKQCHSFDVLTADEE